MQQTFLLNENSTSQLNVPSSSPNAISFGAYENEQINFGPSTAFNNVFANKINSNFSTNQTINTNMCNGNELETANQAQNQLNSQSMYSKLQYNYNYPACFEHQYYADFKTNEQPENVYSQSLIQSGQRSDTASFSQTYPSMQQINKPLLQPNFDSNQMKSNLDQDSLSNLPKQQLNLNNQNQQVQLDQVPQQKTSQATVQQQQHKNTTTKTNHSSTETPLFNKLKQKMTFHGIRMIASLKASSASNEQKKQSNKKENVVISDDNSFYSQSTLTKEELTAHLTQEEKQILQKVFEKEQQFHRETIFSGKGSLLFIPLNKKTEPNDTRTSSSLEGVADLKSDGNIGDSNDKTSTDLGTCRTCRKRIKINEDFHHCDNCDKIICEDCSSYSQKTEVKHWLCSFCRRRNTQPCITDTIESKNLSAPNLPQNRRCSSFIPASCNNQAKSLYKWPSIAEGKNEENNLKRYQVCQQSKNENMTIEKDQIDNTCNKSISNNSQKSSNTNSVSVHLQKSNSCKKHYLNKRPSLQSSNPINLPCTLNSNSNKQLLISNKLPNKLFSSSYSSLDEIVDKKQLNNLSSNQQERLIFNQNNISNNYQLDEEDKNSQFSATNQLASLSTFAQYNYQTQPPYSKSYVNCSNSTRIRKNSGYFKCDNVTLDTSAINNQFLKQFPDKILSNQNLVLKRQSDSQESEDSEHLENILSLNFSDYLRSPRQSSDSDTLGISSINGLENQRKSIPFVLVDTATDPNHLKFKDCFNRRSSQTRTLPKISIEQSRSLLELSQTRTCSTHSLNLPNVDQPRRASAPEGENIKIVIDDVDGNGFLRKQIERVILHRDNFSNNSARSQGFGLCVCGGKLNTKDGQLYALVAWVIPGSPADKMSVKPMDKILQWNGQTLVNLSYEQVAELIANSDDTAELLIEPFNRETKKGAFVHQKHRLSQCIDQNSSSFEFKNLASKSVATKESNFNENLCQMTSKNIFKHTNSLPIGKINLNTSFVNANSNYISNSSTSSSQGNRRKLPRTPESTAHSNTFSVASSLPATNSSTNVKLEYETNGIILQCSMNTDRRELVVNLICAKIFRINTQTFCFGQVSLLPMTAGFKSCKTELSQTLEWNEALIFQSFPIEQIPDMALKINIFEQQNNEMNLIGETVIPLESAIKPESEFWPLLTNLNKASSNLKSSNFTNQYSFANIQPSQNNMLPIMQNKARCTSTEYLSINLLQNQFENKGSIYESRSMPSSRRNSNNNTSNLNVLEAKLYQNLSVCALNTASSANKLSNTSNTLNVNIKGQRRTSASNLSYQTETQQNLHPNVRSSSISILPINNSNQQFELLHNSNNFLPSAKDNLKDEINNNQENINTRCKSSTTLNSNAQFNRAYSLRLAASSSNFNNEKNHNNKILIQKNILSNLKNSNSLNQNQDSKLNVDLSQSNMPYLLKPSLNSHSQLNRQSSQPLAKTMSSLLVQTKDLPNLARPRSSSAIDHVRSKIRLSISANSCSSSEDLTSDTESLSKNLIKKHDLISSSDKTIAEIKLNIQITKGILQINVLEARIYKESNISNPDTYVKTYLKDDEKRLRKKKTRVVFNSFEPQFKQILKYKAISVYNRKLLVMLWQKAKSFEHNSLLGLTELVLNEMDLSKSTTNWFKLSKIDKKDNKLMKQKNKLT